MTGSVRARPGSSWQSSWTRGPSRKRSGWTVVTPWAWSGSAVTGPTQAASTSWWRAASSSGSRPRPSARDSREAAAGALVKVSASRPRATVASSSRSTGPMSCGGIHRYTGTGTTSAPAARSDSTNPGSGSPCSCTAIRRPSTPSSRSRSSTSAMDSEDGDHSSVSPWARIAPLTLGPRARTSTPRSRASRGSPSPHPSAASIQPRKPMAVVATAMSGARPISSSVAASSSPSSASGTMRRAGACWTQAPRRWSSAPSSSARRAAVTPTVNPERGP